VSRDQRAVEILRAGGMLPAGAALPAGEAADTVVARAYAHPVLPGRPVVKLCAASLVAGDDLEMAVLGFSAGEDRGPVGQERRRALGFPGWPLVHDPDRARYALEVVGELKQQTRRAKNKPGHAKEGIDAIGARLGKTVPHFLPSFYEEAGRAFVEHGSTQYAAIMFGKAREAEHVHALAVVEEQRVASFVEFALVGAVTTKALVAYAKELTDHHTPPRAYELFRQLCLQRTLGGVPPWAGMAKELRRLARAAGLDAAAEDAALVGELVDAPALARAAADFWRSYADAVCALAATSPKVRGVLLNLFPAPSGQADAFDDEWLALLERAGALRALVEDGEPAEARPATSRAAWFDRLLAHVSRGWRDSAPPVAVLDLLRRMAPRLAAEGVPIACTRRWGWQLDLDAAELAVSLGVPVSPGKARVDASMWAREADASGRGCDPVHAAAHPVIGPLIVSAVAIAIGSEPFDTAARGKRGFLAAKRAWLEDLLTAAERGALPAIEALLETLRAKVLLPFAELPDLYQRLGRIAVAPVLARTLRGGVLDELGWPALEAAAEELDAGGTAALEVSGAFPIVTIASATRVIAVGAAGRAGSHDLRVPAGYRRHSCWWIGGEFLVLFEREGRLRQYWSHRPDDVFEVDGWAPGVDKLTGRGAVLADGRLFLGDAAIGAGDRATPREAGGVSYDGHTGWRLDHVRGEAVLREVAPRTGDLGRTSLPAFLEAHAGDGVRLVLLASYVLPLPDGADSPLGHAGGLVGACLRRRGGPTHAELVTIDGARWTGLAAGHAPSALLRLPGDDARRPVVHHVEYRAPDRGTIVEPGGAYAIAQIGDKTLDYARGQAAVLPPPFWHLLRPRDPVGSAALRAVSDDDAAALLVAGDDAAAVERAMAAGGLRAISHPRLARGVAGLTALATHCERDLRRLVAERDPTRRAAAAPPPPLDDDALIGAVGSLVTHRQAAGPEATTSAQIQRTAEVFTSDDRQDRVIGGVGAAELSWLTLLAEPSGLAFLAQAPGLTAAQRRAARALLRALAGFTREVPGALRVYTTTGKPPFETSSGPILAWRGGNAYLLCPVGWSGEHEVLEHAPDGTFRALPGMTLDDLRAVPALDTDRVGALCDALDERDPPPWSTEPVHALVARTGLPWAEAALLWAGLPQTQSYTPLDKTIREMLGLKASQATVAHETLRGLPVEQRRRILAGAGDALLADPTRIWVPPGTDDEAALATVLAASWNRVVGRRVAVPDDLVTAAARDVVSSMRPGPALAMIADPEHAPELTGDGRWTLAPSGELARVDGDAPVFTRSTLAAAVYLPYLYAALPVGDPLRATVPRAHARFLERLANPTLLVRVGQQWFHGKPEDTEASLAAALDAHGGDDLPAPLSGRRRPGTRVVRDARHPQLTLWLAPAELPDLAVLSASMPLERPYYEHGITSLTLLRLLRSPALARMMARIEDTPVPAGGWEQDPSRSAADIVAAARASLGLSTEAATLYLQMLTLPMPTPKNVQTWNGWAPAVYKKAIGELVGKQLVLEAKRERAQRSHFLPGGWEPLKAPLPPMETWKVAALGREPALGRYLPVTAFHEQFAAAWQRIADGDRPRYDDIEGGKR
jgi:hypothetical protein